MLNSYFSNVVLDLSDSSNNPLINGAFDSFYPYFGDTYSPLVTTPDWWEYGFGYAIGFYDETSNDPYPQYASALIFSDAHYNAEPTYLDGDILYIFHGYSMTEKYDSIGSYLVRDPTTRITIDIKPSKKPGNVNVINPKKDRNLKVAIVGSDSFDALQVDPTTVKLNPGDASPTRYKGQDYNRDGYSDLVLTFKLKETGIVCGVTEATLTGQTDTDPVVYITGTDSITIKGCP